MKQNLYDQMSSKRTVVPHTKESRESKYHRVLQVLAVLVCCVLSGCTKDELRQGQDGHSGSQKEFEPSTSSSPSIRSNANDSIDYADLLRFNKEATRLLALRLQLGNATQSSLQSVLAQSTNIPSVQLQQEVQNEVMRELALISPDTALNSIAEFSSETKVRLMRVLFQVWSISNLDLSIQTAANLEGLEKIAAVEGILLSRDDLSEHAQQELTRAVFGEDYIDLPVGEIFVGEDIVDAESVWSEFISQNENELSELPTLHIVQLARIAVALERAIGLGAFDRILQDIPSGSTRFGVLASLLDNIAREEPSRALDVVLELKPEGTQFLAARIVTSWAQSDPESALDAIARIEATGLRSSLQYTVLYAWVDLDPIAVMEDTERVPLSLRSIVNQRALTTIAFSTPERAATMLDQVENYHGKLSVGEAIVANWSKTDFQAALNWIQNSPQIVNKTMRHDLMSTALDFLAQSDPEAAFGYALQEAVDTANVGLESTVVATVARLNLSAGIDLLSRVRNDATRVRAIHLIGTHLVVSGESQEAIELSMQLPLKRRGKYLESLVPSLLHSDPGVLADHLDSISSHQARARTASMLLARYRGKAHVFSDEQISKLQQYVDDELVPGTLEMISQ